MSGGSTRADEGDRSVDGWNDEADVVIVGLGCAGACAALEARAAGADALVLERAGGGGGTSANAGGLIYLGGGTPVQKACGFDDEPDEMFKFLIAASGAGAEEDKIRLLCDDSVSHFHWLVEHGVPFKESFSEEPGMEAPNDDCLCFSGGEHCFPFADLARPAPRAHKPQANAAAGGFLMQRLIAAFEGSGARFEANTRCTDLVVEDGRVVGVVAVSAGRERRTRARRGVVLCAGGFTMDPEMLATHAPLIGRCSVKNATDGDDGSGIRMAQRVGAATVRMEGGEVALPATIPNRLGRGIFVNRFGQRFVDEGTYFGHIGQEALFHQDGRVFLVLDEPLYEINIVGMEATWVGETIEELEREAGFPVGSLQATVAYYNEHAERGEDPLFHKRDDLLRPIVNAPYAVLDCSTENAIYAGFTTGGLRTDLDGAVLSTDGDAIPGLYAAGRTAALLSGIRYPASGISLADASYFGRRAGRTAAAQREPGS